MAYEEIDKAEMMRMLMAEGSGGEVESLKKVLDTNLENTTEEELVNAIFTIRGKDPIMDKDISTEQLNRAIQMLRDDKYTMAETAEQLGVSSKSLAAAISAEASAASEAHVINTMNELHEQPPLTPEEMQALQDKYDQHTAPSVDPVDFEAERAQYERNYSRALAGYVFVSNNEIDQSTIQSPELLEKIEAVDAPFEPRTEIIFMPNNEAPPKPE